VLVALPLQVKSSALARTADDASDPDSPSYRHFTSLASIAAIDGAARSSISHDRATLRDDGLQLALDPTHGAFWGSVTAAEVDRYFGTDLVEHGGVVAPERSPIVPHGLAGITGVVGLTATAPSKPSGAQTSNARQPCPSSIPTRDSLARRYGFTTTLGAGDTGAGTSIDIVSISSLEPAVLSEYDRCTDASLSGTQITQSAVPDAPATGGGAEIALDSLVLTLLAPRAHLNVVRFDLATPLSFPLLELLATGTTPDLLDITVVYCEDRLAPPAIALSEWLLSALAATGTTAVAAAGDTGSSGCHPQSDAPAVTYPASSAFVSAVGGVSYQNTAGDPRDLSVWNEPGTSGGGGGTSTVIAPPPWQPGPKRELPDAAAYAVPGGVGEIPVCTSPSVCTWQAVGGTSLTATVMGALGVLLSQELSTGGRPKRFGDLAGLVWRDAKRASALTDVTVGANTTFTGACCTARVGYDLASGWGLFDPDALRALVTGSSS
jgi:subtilase family serine protease